MSQYLWFFIISISYLCADTLEKKKILEIIKAAKEHKTVSKSSIHYDTQKSGVPKSEPHVVYRKKEIPVVYRKRDTKIKVESKHVIYGTLPALSPSSIELQKRFSREVKDKSKEVFFTKPQHNRGTGMNTEAIKIEYE